jgi:hypothetical protein
VNGQKLDEWTKSHVFNIVRGWGYAENSFRLWSRFDSYDGGIFKLREDDDYLEVATYIVGSRGDAPIYVDHIVENGNNSDCDSEYDSDYAK